MPAQSRRKSSMIPRELIKKIRRIEIKTRHLVEDLFSGEYHSIFKGRGMEFAEVREYIRGDEIRTIDWNVTARMNKPYVKQFCEERELTVMLMVDASCSEDFGTAGMVKSELAAEISALLAFSAIKNNDRVGLMIFTDKVEKYLPPKKGKEHVIRVIREVLCFKPGNASTDIGEALTFLSRVTRRKSVVFLLSDFIADSGDYEKQLRIVSKKHDLTTISLSDRHETELPDIGLIDLEDSETGEIITIDTSEPSVRRAFKNMNVKEGVDRKRRMDSLNIDSVNLRTDDNYVKPLTSFFKGRAKRLR
jgi:uncharacterized protein (DUF58 family)